MSHSNTMEFLYEDYLTSPDKTVEIDGYTFYKIIHKDRMSIGDGIVTICVSKEISSDIKNMQLMDDWGRTFIVRGIVHMCFGVEIPRWFLETYTIAVHGIHEINQIGSHVAAIPVSDKDSNEIQKN